LKKVVDFLKKADRLLPVMKIKVFDIDYDIDDETMNEFIEEGVDAQLPNHFIFNDVDNVDELADRISNETGWCVNTFKYVEL
jgi:hypothetical protein